MHRIDIHAVNAAVLGLVLIHTQFWAALFESWRYARRRSHSVDERKLEESWWGLKPVPLFLFEG